MSNLIPRHQDAILDDRDRTVFKTSVNGSVTNFNLEVYETDVRVDSSSVACTVTLPYVAEAKGVIMTVTQVGTGTNNITVQDRDESSNWTDVVLNAAGEYVIVRSDGIKWHVVQSKTS